MELWDLYYYHKYTNIINFCIMELWVLKHVFNLFYNNMFLIEFSPSVIFTEDLDFEATTMGIEAREKGSTS